MIDIPVSQLTEASLQGAGVFDVLMRATKAHLDEEYSKNRIKGPEYAQVYLGSLTQILQTATQFLLEQRKSDLEARLLEAQIAQAEAQVLLVNAQTELAIQEKKNAENQWLLLAEQKAKMIAETKLIDQQADNAVIEGEVLTQQVCKLKAEFDLLSEQKLKAVAETGLLNQKNMTEKAQTVSMGVDDDSVIGRQKLLYQAQTNGFQRDAEQKAAKLLVDSWNVRRTTDEGTVADGTNMLNDVAIGRAVKKLLAGVDA